MKKILIFAAIFTSVLLLLRMFPDHRRPMTAKEVYASMQNNAIKTSLILKSPNADKPIRAEGSNLTQHTWRPPEGTPTPAPTPQKIPLGLWFIDWFFGGGPSPGTGYSK
jgi:hypothetical protein